MFLFKILELVQHIFFVAAHPLFVIIMIVDIQADRFEIESFCVGFACILSQFIQNIFQVNIEIFLLQFFQYYPENMREEHICFPGSKRKGTGVFFIYRAALGRPIGGAIKNNDALEITTAD